MERIVAKCSRHEEIEKANREFYRCSKSLNSEKVEFLVARSARET